MLRSRWAPAGVWLRRCKVSGCVPHRPPSLGVGHGTAPWPFRRPPCVAPGSLRPSLSQATAASCRGLSGTPSPASASAASAPLSPTADALKIVAGIAGFLGFDAAVRLAIDTCGLHLLPSQICSMLSAFGGLSLAHALAPAAASQAHQALMPAVGWVGRWLPVFLVPVQVTLPTILFPGGAAEAAGLGLLLAGGWAAAVAGAARLVLLLAPQLPAAEASAAAKAAGPRKLLPFCAAWLLLAAATAPLGVWPELWEGPEERCRQLRGAALAALGVGSFALAVHRGLPGHLCFLANGAATIAGAAAMAAARGESYSQVVKRDYLVGAQGPPGTGDMLLWCLGPALVSTGVQMFQYRARIASLSKVLFLTCGAVSLCNVLGTAAAGPLLGVSPDVTLAATMRCVTIPMALPTYARLCEVSGAENNVALVALCAGVSGFIGFGPQIKRGGGVRIRDLWGWQRLPLHLGLGFRV
ncbi:PLGG1 [Symbiodinium natans]|uniref:PLGG1 protein n=1 Tax=Symbiodinium natans TaxID=878477 RepID=A0A812MH10_9DINO|nr:PLGG1 [Symbiodinium natans]